MVAEWITSKFFPRSRLVKEKAHFPVELVIMAILFVKQNKGQ